MAYYHNSHKDTSVDYVLQKMKYKENCIIKKGFFPDSAKDLEDKFCFVSIDVDLERATFSSLEYFYPRLSVGGYIMIHDYNTHLLGVKNAINAYEEMYETLKKVPICDESGSIVITK